MSLVRIEVVLTHEFAEVDDSIEGFDGEVHLEVHFPEVGQLHLEHLVHGGELELRGSGHPALVKRGAGVGEPDIFPGPPQGMVGPVRRNICQREGEL